MSRSSKKGPHVDERLLGRVEKMGRIARVEMQRKPHLLVFDRQRRGMGVRHEDTPLAAFLKFQ